MGGSLAEMATVRDIESTAYRGVEILLLLPVALYAFLGIGIMFLGFSNSEAGVTGAAAALGIWYIALIGVAIISWLATPILLYLDTKKIKDGDVDWEPNPVLYAVAGFFFGYLMKIHHIYKRHQYVVDWVERDQWWYVVAVGTVVPTLSLVAAFTIGLSTASILPFLFVGLAILLAVPFPLAIYRDATYVRLNSGSWQPNPGNYLGFAVLFFFLAPISFPITGGYYLVRRHMAIGTV